MVRPIKKLLPSCVVAAASLLSVIVLPRLAAQTLLPNSSNSGTAYCVDSRGYRLDYCNVTIPSGYFTNSNSHIHVDVAAPSSNISPTSGNTGCCGLPITIQTTRVGQVEWLEVCAVGGSCNETDFVVGYGDLNILPGYASYVQVGSITIHPNNHNGTQNAILGIQAIADQYHGSYPQYPIIAINDMALPVGGVLDLNRNWTSPHIEHDRGTAVDIRGNGGPNSIPLIPDVQQAFIDICFQTAAVSTAFFECCQGCTPCPNNVNPDSNQHVHARFPF